MNTDWRNYRKRINELLPDSQLSTLKREIKFIFASFFRLFLYNYCSREIAAEQLAAFLINRGWITEPQSRRLTRIPLQELDSGVNEVYVSYQEPWAEIIWNDFQTRLPNQVWHKLLHRARSNQLLATKTLMNYDLVAWDLDFSLPQGCMRFLQRKRGFTTEVYTNPICRTLDRYYSLFASDQELNAINTNEHWITSEDTHFVICVPWQAEIIKLILLQIKQRMQRPTTLCLLIPYHIVQPQISISTEIQYKSESVLPANSAQLFRAGMNKTYRINQPLYIAYLSNQNCDYQIQELVPYLQYRDTSTRVIPRGRRFQNGNRNFQSTIL